MGLACSCCVAFALSCSDGGAASDLGEPRDLGSDDGDVLLRDSGRPDDGTAADDGTSADGDDHADALDATSPWLPAADYCELTVDVFCPYYLRCGRMAVDDLDTCRAVFLEACNGLYEPHYRALEARGALRLSKAGVAACDEHLSNVACERQVFDLEGGCSGLWEGTTAVGGPCAPGIESFVCDGASTCVLSLDFCGTCTPVAPAGEPCGNGVACAPDDDCQAGVCVARAAAGEPCDPVSPCRLGTACVGGVCAGPQIVAVGEACGGTSKCPYRSACVAGACVVSPLHGEACGPSLPCASGFCDAGVCAPLRLAGDGCSAPSQCVSGVCDGTCGTLPGACFE